MLLSLFYRSTIQSIISFCIIAWGGNISVLCKTKIDRCVKRAEKITCSSFDFVDDLITSLSLKKIKQIENSDHPLAIKIQRSVRSNRLIFVKT